MHVRDGKTHSWLAQPITDTKASRSEAQDLPHGRQIHRGAAKALV